MKFLLMLMLLPQLAFAQIILTKDNHVSIRSVVDSDSVGEVILKMSKLSDGKKTLYLFLDTPGGSVFSGLDLITYLKANNNYSTITSFAASMGFQIAQGNPGERIITPTGILMSHPMSGGIHGEMGEGLSLGNTYNLFKEIIATMDADVVSRTAGKYTLESYQKAYDNELWTSGQNAVNSGFADSVNNVSCDSELSKNLEETKIRYNLEIPISVEIKYAMSSCPLVNGLLKYQIALVDIRTEKKFIVENKGYETEKAENSLLDMLTKYKESMERSDEYNKFKYMQTRDMKYLKGIKFDKIKSIK
jgi:ATP-dependent protease ClpP protease subunit